jgi:site-specific recombinase XerD
MKKRTNAIKDLAVDYVSSCRARGLSLGALEQYRFCLEDVFAPWCAANDIFDIAQLDQRCLDRFTSHLLTHGGKRGGLSPNTVHSYVRPVRQLLKWAAAVGEPVTGAEPQLPRLPRRVVNTLSPDEIDQLERAATRERDKVIVRLLIETGVRAGELCKLNRADLVRRDRRTLLHVRGKGAKERLVPLVDHAFVRRFERHISALPTDAEGDAIFVSHRRSPDGMYSRLTPSGVLQMLRRVAYRTTIDKRIFTHLLRHTFTTECLRNEMGAVSLAKVLGHSGTRMIEDVYSHLTEMDAYDAMAAMRRRQHRSE